jgi:MFS family permease
MAAFPLVGWAVQAWGWRGAWMGVGVAIAAVLAPLAALVVRRSPEAVGLAPDSDAGTVRGGSRPEAPATLNGYTWTAALAMPSFWVFATGTALYGLVASGIGLFNESILAERGFGPDVYYQTLAVTAMTALAGNFLGGWLSHRVPLGRLMAASQAILAGGVFALPWVGTLAHVMAWAAAMGVGGGLVMVLFFSVWGRLFGRAHLGRIQGVAQALTVVASAVGPLLLAWGVARTGSYAGVFHALAAVIAASALSALVVSLPDPPPVFDAMTSTGGAVR